MIEDGRDLGQRTSVDQKRRHLAFAIDVEKLRRAHVVFLKGHRLSFKGNADLMERDMHGKGACTWREVEREHAVVDLFSNKLRLILRSALSRASRRMGPGYSIRYFG